MTDSPKSRFTAQSHTAEDLLKEQTFGLVHLSDFRKRRAEAEEAAAGHDSGSGANTPDSREHATFKPKRKKLSTNGLKKKDGKKTGALSFGHDEGDEGQDDEGNVVKESKATSRSATPAVQPDDTSTPTTDSEQLPAFTKKKRLAPSATVAFAPKAQTKGALIREAHLKEALRKEYVLVQEAVRQTEFMLPFTFYDGKATPGGACRMRKGDPIWLFLEQARKVGAAGGDKSRKDWARIGVDDLMVVRGEVVIPHHYDFHYFLLNRSVGYTGQPIFQHSAEPTTSTPKDLLPQNIKDASSDNDTVPLSTAELRAQQKQVEKTPDSLLEGFSDDPSLTKVVDRRWYERHKHIYPASIWEDFDPQRDYSKGPRKDGEGNAFFFSATKR